MKNFNSIIADAKNTILTEDNTIANLVNLLDTNFKNTIKFILNSKGKIIVTGIGKSANITAKTVATFNSTGTPAIFIHATDALNSYLSILQKEDVVIRISKSGNTPEIKVLVPLIKRNNNKLIAITDNIDSYLGTHADFTLNSYVKKESCLDNLAPTTSTTAQLVLGNAMAVCLLHLKGFTSSDFTKYHPDGTLRKRLHLRVSDCIKNNERPQVKETNSVSDIITEKKLGVTAVLNTNNKISRIITNGDIKRMLAKTTDIKNPTTKDIMGKNQKTLLKDAMAIEALKTLGNNNITQILVVNETKTYQGVVHLHDLIK